MQAYTDVREQEKRSATNRRPIYTASSGARRYKQDEKREAFRCERTQTYVSKKNVARQTVVLSTQPHRGRADTSKTRSARLFDASVHRRT